MTVSMITHHQWADISPGAAYSSTLLGCINGYTQLHLGHDSVSGSGVAMATYAWYNVASLAHRTRWA